jgi:hypothetical protein
MTLEASPKAAAPSAEETQKAEIAAQELRASYAIAFGGEHGVKVLANLKKTFGWQGNVERPSAHRGERVEDVFLTEGGKEVVRHILAMIEAAPDRPQPVDKAIS